VCLCCKCNHIGDLGKKVSVGVFKYNICCRRVTVKVATMSLQNTMMNSLMTQNFTNTMVGTGTNQSILGFSSIRYCLSIRENLTRRNMRPMEPCYDMQCYVDTIVHHENNASNFQVVLSVCLIKPSSCAQLSGAHSWTKHTLCPCEQSAVCRAK